MLHCDEETLSLLALGEPGAADVEAHLAECPSCGGELAALRAVVNAARSPEPAARHSSELDDRFDENAHPVHRVTPPPSVWTAIAAATGVEARPRPEEVARHAGSVEPMPFIEPDAPKETASTRAPVPSPRSWRSRLDTRLLAVAAAGLVFGLVGGVIGNRVLTDDGEPTAPVIAATELAGLPAAPTASGKADVVRTAQGRTLDLDVRKLGAADGFYEVWLIDPTVTKMVPVGVLSGGQGRFVLPAGVDLADYPLVDVSVEPLDGNPAHSGKSVLRGTLRS